MCDILTKLTVRCTVGKHDSVEQGEMPLRGPTLPNCLTRPAEPLTADELFATHFPTRSLLFSSQPQEAGARPNPQEESLFRFELGRKQRTRWRAISIPFLPSRCIKANILKICLTFPSEELNSKSASQDKTDTDHRRFEMSRFRRGDGVGVNGEFSRRLLLAAKLW